MILIFFAMLGVILGGRIGYVLFYGLDVLGEGSRWSPDCKLWDGAACPSTVACWACSTAV